MRAERGKRVLGFTRARRYADVSAAHRKRVVEQQPREWIVVDDQQAQLASVRHAIVGSEARHSLLTIAAWQPSKRSTIRACATGGCWASCCRRALSCSTPSNDAGTRI